MAYNGWRVRYQSGGIDVSAAETPMRPRADFPDKIISRDADNQANDKVERAVSILVCLSSNLSTKRARHRWRFSTGTAIDGLGPATELLLLPLVPTELRRLSLVLTGNPSISSITSSVSRSSLSCNSASTFCLISPKVSPPACALSALNNQLLSPLLYNSNSPWSSSSSTS